MVRLRQLFQSQSADDHPSGAAEEPELRRYRPESEVMRINVDGSGKRATGVTFVDTSGEEWEQPADLVILAAFTIFNVHLLLMSGIGKPYDPVTDQGVIGRNFTHQTISTRQRFFDKDKLTSIRSSPPARSACASTNSTATISTMGRSASSAADTWARCRPMAAPSDDARCRRTPRWGAEWKSAVRDNYLSRHPGPACMAAATATATSISTSTRL